MCNHIFNPVCDRVEITHIIKHTAPHPPSSGAGGFKILSGPEAALVRVCEHESRAQGHSASTGCREKNPAPAYNLQRPASAGSLALNAASIRPLTSASGSLTQKIHRPDYSKEIGLWVAKRLSDLQAAEDDTATRLNEGRQARQLDDPQLWDADQVSLWLREVVGLSEPTIAHLHAQDIHGLELFTLMMLTSARWDVHSLRGSGCCR